MKTEQRDENTAAGPLSSVKNIPEGSFRSVLKNRSFVLLWLAQLLSQIVFNAANYGIIIVVTEITHSTALVGLAIISFTLPAVPFSLLAGVYVDYLDKRLVLWVTNILRAIATGLVVLSLLWNSQAVIPLYLLAFVISLITQFFVPAEASAIPLLVSKKNLVPALSLFNITLTIAQAFGFLVLGGLLTAFLPPFHLSLGIINVQVQSFDVLFAIVSVGYVICALLILAIPAYALQQKLLPESELPKSLGKEAWNIIWQDVKETWVYIGKDRPLLLALLQVSFVSVLLLVVGELAGPFVVDVLHLSVNDIPLIFAPAGVGLVLGGLLMPSLTRRLGKGRSIIIGSLITAAGLVSIPLSRFIWTQLTTLTSGFLFLMAAITFVIGIALDMINIPAQTVMQEHAPEKERGRVFSFQGMMYNLGSIPVLLFAGVIADIVGIETVMYLLAASIVAFLGWARWFSRRSVVS